MSESKHTPGEWLVSDREVEVDGLSAIVIESADPLIDGQRAMIAAVIGIETAVWPDAGSTTDNARLIAAAPAMLKALEDISKSCRFPVDEVQRAIRNRARLTIALAGGTP